MHFVISLTLAILLMVIYTFLLWEKSFPHKKIYGLFSLLLIFLAATLAHHLSPLILGFYLLFLLLSISYWGYGDGSDLVFQILANWLTGIGLLQVSYWDLQWDSSVFHLLISCLAYALLLGLFPFHGWFQLFCERAPFSACMTYLLLVQPHLIHAISSCSSSSTFMSWFIAIGGAFYGLYFGLLAFREESLLGSIAYFFLAQNGLYLLYAPFVTLPEYFLWGLGLSHGVLYYFAQKEESGPEHYHYRMRALYPYLIVYTLCFTGLLSLLLYVQGFLAKIHGILVISGILITAISGTFLFQWWHCLRRNFYKIPKPSSALHEMSSLFYLVPYGIFQIGEIFHDPSCRHMMMLIIAAVSLIFILWWIFTHWIKNLKCPRRPRRWTGILIASTLLFLFFRFYLHQSYLGVFHWITILFLTGLFPFQFFTPIFFGNSSYRSIAYVCIGLRAIGLLLVFLWFQSPELYDRPTMNAFYFFPVASIVIASILAFKADHFKYFLACNDALVNGFLVLNSTVFYFLPLPGFGSVALALVLVLFIVSGLRNTTEEANYEADFLALFHSRPCLAIIWTVGLLFLSGIFPIGHSWQWRLLSIFYARHQWWILWPSLIAMVLASCAYWRWIHAAMKYPHTEEMRSPIFPSRPLQTLLALAISLLLCLSWIFPFYEP
ncbi:MAG: hypothetical protein LBD40_01745 [Puniceicoccales bacterium]|nr:hypothetical protein [Puniceicoccales bacterium]